MSDYIKVNTGAINRDAGTMEESIQRIRKRAASLKEAMQQLDEMWDGPSSEAFKASFQADREALEGIIKGLDEIHRYATEAKNKYDSCEGKVAGLISQIRV